MKKLVYSDIDSNSPSTLKIGTPFTTDDEHVLKIRTPDYNSNSANHVNFLPSVLDSAVIDMGTSDFEIRVGDSALSFVRHSDSSNMLRINNDNHSIDVDSKVVSSSNVEFTSSGIKFSNGDYITQNPVRWTMIADTSVTNTAISLPPGYATVGDLLSGAIEGMIVSRDGTEYETSVTPTAAVTGYPAVFPIHRGGTHLGSFTFTSETDTTFTVTVNSADNIKVFMR